MFAALLLAAGQGRRFHEAGGDAWKLLAEIAPSRTVIRQSCENLLACGWPVYVVTGKREEETRAALAGLDVAFVHNRDPEAGLGSSIASGVAAVAHAEGWLLALGDMPFIQPDTVRRVAASLQAGAAICFPQYNGRRGHPVGLSRSFGAELMSLGGDMGAQAVLALHKEQWAAIDVADEGILRDIDVPADLHR